MMHVTRPVGGQLIGNVLLGNARHVRDHFVGATSRAGEERHVAVKLATLHVPILRTIGGTGTLEGGDVLWANPRLVLVGVGRHTNGEGARQLADCLAEQGVRAVRVTLPSGVRHLLDVVRVLDADLALVRTSIAGPGIARMLDEAGFAIVPIAESDEINRKRGMNCVVLAPRTVLMPDGAPAIEQVLRGARIEIADRVPTTQLARAGGGLDGATGILRRVLVAESFRRP